MIVLNYFVPFFKLLNFFINVVTLNGRELANQNVFGYGDFKSDGILSSGLSCW